MKKILLFALLFGLAFFTSPLIAEQNENLLELEIAKSLRKAGCFQSGCHSVVDGLHFPFTQLSPNEKDLVLALASSRFINLANTNSSLLCKNHWVIYLTLGAKFFLKILMILKNYQL